MVFSMIIMVVSIVNAQQTKEQKPKYKNLKVIRDLSQVDKHMEEFTKGLGVKCEHCHVKDNYADDGKKEKYVARYMIQMTEQVNKNFYKGEKVVTCVSCHRGSPKVK